MTDLTIPFIILVLVITGIIITLFRGNTPRRKVNERSEYLRAAADKLRGERRSNRYSWRWFFMSDFERRRDYYINDYLKSEEWQRKRHVVLKRDNWRCVYCGRPATQVHHKRYAKRNIGHEPIEWLVSICRPCHESIHR